MSWSASCSSSSARSAHRARRSGQWRGPRRDSARSAAVPPTPPPAASPIRAPAPPPPPPGRPLTGRLVDETVERDEAAPPAEELLRFRDRLERTAHDLTHDYDALLGRLSYTAVTPPSGPTISFARGAPSLDIVYVDGLRDAAARAFETDPAGTTAYGTSIGYPRLRAWIADRHGVEPERVLVTNGSMQADAFLFDHLVRSGDEVVVERPTMTPRCSPCVKAARACTRSSSRPTASTRTRSPACSREEVARARGSRTSSPTSRTRPGTRSR